MCLFKVTAILAAHNAWRRVREPLTRGSGAALSPIACITLTPCTPHVYDNFRFRCRSFEIIIVQGISTSCIIKFYYRNAAIVPASINKFESYLKG